MIGRALMKSILLITPQPGLASAVQAALPPATPRLIHRASLEEAEALLHSHLVSLCLLDVGATDVQTIWAVEKIRRIAPAIPVIVLVDSANWEWQEEAVVRGVAYVLIKPIRPRLLQTVIERLTQAPEQRAPVAPAAPPTPPATARIETAPAPPPPTSVQPLAVLRDFSGILKHSLSAEPLLNQFLLLLRELTGVNRAAIFLRQASAGAGADPQHASRLHCACALGLPASLGEHIGLSTDSGIGAFLKRHGRILQRQSGDAQTDAEIAKEFELLGGQVAVPMLDRESLLGVAIFDERLTGGPLTNAELNLIFHLLEEIGLAIKNIRLHEQLAASHQTLGNVLRQINAACIVIGGDLSIRHANKAALRAFARPGQGGREMDFADLPPALASKVRQVTQTGSGIETFDYEPADQPQTTHRVTIVPLERNQSGAVDSVLLIAEDQSLARQMQRLQLDSARLRLLKAAADRLAHEINNALLAPATYLQLLPKSRAALDEALNESVRRIGRLGNQMRYIARDGVVEPKAVPLAELVKQAYEEARKYFPVKSSELNCEADKRLTVPGDADALRLALSETILNALQANPDDAKVNVRLGTDSNGGAQRWARIEVEDNGTGFTADAAKHAVEPFFTTRTVGLGLGLTVSQRIIETHHGKLEIKPSQPGEHGIVRISLPAEPVVSAN